MFTVKKFLFFLFSLSFLFLIGIQTHSFKKANAQPVSPCAAIKISKTGTGFMQNVNSSKIFKLNIASTNLGTCTYTFKGSPVNNTASWNFYFYRKYVGGVVSEQITSNSQLSLAAGANKDFFVLVTPSTNAKKTPGDKTLKIETNTTSSTGNEQIKFTVTNAMACDARELECGNFTSGTTLELNCGTCTSGKTCKSNKCTTPAAQTKDLIISAFTFPGGNEDKTSDPVVKIKNTGNAKITGEFDVKVINRNGGASKTYRVKQDLSPNEELPLSSHFANMPNPAAGKYTATAKIDSNISPLNPNGEIIESNEGNNTKTDDYTTTKPSGGGSGGGNGGGTPTPTCDRNAPSLDISPANKNGNPGDERVYEVVVKNNDKGANCDPVTFVLSKELLPTDKWVGKFDDATLDNIGKNGGTKTTKYRVTSPTGATKGEKTISIGVRRQSQDKAIKTVNATYTVTTSDTKPPSPKPEACNKNTPKLSFASNTITANPGEAATYKMIIEGQDTGDCSPRTFKIKAEGPNDNWKIVLAKQSEDVKPGSKGTIDLVVTSPTGATPGNKTITVKLINPNNDVAVTKTVTYVVPGGSCVEAAPSFSVSPQTKTGKPGDSITFDNIEIKNNDSGPCADRKFTLQVEDPGDGWEPGYFGQDFTLKPGETENTNLMITSPSNAAPGNKNIVLNLLHNNNKVSSIVVIFNVDNNGDVTPEPGKSYMNLTLGIDGIGDTPRIPSIVDSQGNALGGNLNPAHNIRNLDVRIYNTSDNSLAGAFYDQTFTYNSGLKRFTTRLDVPLSSGQTGNYNVYVSGPRFLNAQYPGSASIAYGQTVELSSRNFFMITGNVNNSDMSENKIDLMDYNLLLSCSIYSQDKSACDQDPNYESYSDLDDNGIVNEDDLTLFTSEYANQQGVILPN